MDTTVSVLKCSLLKSLFKIYNMKKRNLTSLKLNKKSVSALGTEKNTGGVINTFNCGPSNNAWCTFDDRCFSKGAGCSRWQVC